MHNTERKIIYKDPSKLEMRGGNVNLRHRKQNTVAELKALEIKEPRVSNRPLYRTGK